MAPARHDALLASIGRVFHADTELTVGAKILAQPPLAPLQAKAGNDDIAIAVVGAHLSGMALNGELKALGGRLTETAVTAADYKLYALDTEPPRPGLLRVKAGTGAAIELDVWTLSASGFGRFVARRRCPSAPYGSPTVAASRASLWSLPRSTARATFPISAAGAPTWRNLRRCE